MSPNDTFQEEISEQCERFKVRMDGVCVCEVQVQIFFQKGFVLTQSFSGGRTNGNNFSMDAGAALCERKTMWKDVVT